MASPILAAANVGFRLATLLPKHSNYSAVAHPADLFHRDTAEHATCSPGLYVAAAGTSTSDTDCAVWAPGAFQPQQPNTTIPWSQVRLTRANTCFLGTFSSTENADSCDSWRNCRPGFRVYLDGTPSSDRLCVACGKGEIPRRTALCLSFALLLHFDIAHFYVKPSILPPTGTYTSSTNTGSCSSWSTCVAGKYMSAAGTSTSNRQCLSCGSGKCAGAVLYVLRPDESLLRFSASPFSPQNSSKLAPPATGTYSTTSNQLSCVAWLNCAAGKYVSNAGSSTNDRSCANCDGGTRKGIAFHVHNFHNLQ